MKISGSNLMQRIGSVPFGGRVLSDDTVLYGRETALRF
jgi:hypothetical protein